MCIPRTSDPEHARQNIDVFDFELTGAEMDEIFDLSHLRDRQVDPVDLAPDWD